MLKYLNDSDFMGTFLRIFLVVFGVSAAFSLLVTFFSYLSSALRVKGQVTKKERGAQTPTEHLTNFKFYMEKISLQKRVIVNFCKYELFFTILLGAGTVCFLISLFSTDFTPWSTASGILILLPVARNYQTIRRNGGFKHTIKSLNKSVMPYLPPTETVYDVYREYEHGEREYLGTRTERDAHVGENMVALILNVFVKLFKFFLIFGASYGIGFFFLLLALYYCVFGSLGFNRNRNIAAQSFKRYVAAASLSSFAIIAFPVCVDPKQDRVPKRVMSELAIETMQCERENRVPEILCTLCWENTYCVSSGNRFLFSGSFDGTDYRIYENSVGLTYTYQYDENTLAGADIPFSVEPELQKKYENSPVSDDLIAFFNWMQFEYLKYKKENENGSRIIRLFDYGKNEQNEAPLSSYVLDESNHTFSVNQTTV